MLFFRLNATTDCINQYFTPLERESEIEMCSQFLFSFQKENHRCILFSVGKANPVFSTECILHVCEVKSVFPAGHS